MSEPTPTPILTELHITRVYSDGTTQTINRRFEKGRKNAQKLAVLAENDVAKITKFNTHFQILLRVKRKENHLMKPQHLLQQAVKLITNLIFNLHEAEL